MPLRFQPASFMFCDQGIYIHAGTAAAHKCHLRITAAAMTCWWKEPAVAGICCSVDSSIHNVACLPSAGQTPHYSLNSSPQVSHMAPKGIVGFYFSTVSHCDWCLALFVIVKTDLAPPFDGARAWIITVKSYFYNCSFFFFLNKFGFICWCFSCMYKHVQYR